MTDIFKSIHLENYIFLKHKTYLLKFNKTKKPKKLNPSTNANNSKMFEKIKWQNSLIHFPVVNY